MSISVEDVEGIAAPIVTATGMDLEDVFVQKVGRREKLTVVVDADGGVDLDAIADLSTALSAELDSHEDIAASPYVLEVTSPGVDRPLTQPRHWRRAQERLVAVDLTDGSQLLGRVISADDEAANVDVDGEQVRVRYADVTRAVVQVEFDRKEG